MFDIRQALAKDFGIRNPSLHHNLTKRQLFHAAIENDRGRTVRGGGYHDQKAHATKLGENGPLVFITDPDCTGRPVDDTFAVAWPDIESKIWWKPSLQTFDPDRYARLLPRVIEHVNQYQGPLYVQDVIVGHDQAYALPYRFVGQYASHAYFASNMFVKPAADADPHDWSDSWTMLNIQTFECDPARDGCRSDRAAILDFRNKLCLVLGRADYCGLVKKSIFTVMNFLLPNDGILSMHCAANVGADGDSAIMFGLSGTGKTTLSADPNRRLIGDDETGWTQDGISNLEDGCYAKLINLDKEAEPVIANALSLEGTLIENVPAPGGLAYEQIHPQELDLFDSSIAENTRFSYSLACNPNLAEGAKGPHPKTIVMLTADSFGVLPPIAVLDENEAMYHFVQGFTARVAGTEIGITEPEATFSSCFGAPFMTHKPIVYANLLKEKMQASQARCVLLNTGWIGGRAGEAPRISLAATRALLSAAIRGDFHDASAGIEIRNHPILGIRYPLACADVDASIMDPRQCWSDKSGYDRITAGLRDKFRMNFRDNGFAAAGIPDVI